MLGRRCSPSGLGWSGALMGPSRNARALPQDFCVLQQSWAQDTRRRAIQPRRLTALTSWRGRLVRFWQPAQRDCGKGRAGRLNVLTPTTGHDCSRLLRYYLRWTVDKRPGLLDICSTWECKCRGQWTTSRGDLQIYIAFVKTNSDCWLHKALTFFCLVFESCEKSLKDWRLIEWTVDW